MKVQGEAFKFFVDGESKTVEETKSLIHDNMTITIKGLDVFYFSPKKETKTEKLLKEAEEHQKQNGGVLQGGEFPFDTVNQQLNNYVFFKDELQAQETAKQIISAVKNAKKEMEGQKHNEDKLPIDTMLTVQFPKAIQAVCKASLFGHEKYKETDKDWLNYKRVIGGSTTYANAGQRHNFNKAGKDEQSGLPHIIHKCWNALAELELWIEENKYE